MKFIKGEIDCFVTCHRQISDTSHLNNKKLYRRETFLTLQSFVFVKISRHQFRIIGLS